MSRFQVVKSKITNERQELLEKFVHRLDTSRIQSGYKPLGPKFYATKMALIPTNELHMFYKELDQSKNFCALWWWKCKKKPVDK